MAYRSEARNLQCRCLLRSIGQVLSNVWRHCAAVVQLSQLIISVEK